MAGSETKSFLDSLLSWAGFACLSVAIVGGTWLFGAWEMWWFWLFALVIFAGTLLFALRLVGRGLASNDRDDAIDPEGMTNRRLAACLVAGVSVFAVYAFVRFTQAEVFMDAERSFLLYATGFLVGAQALFGFDRLQAGIMFRLILANLTAIALYGIVNHCVTGSSLVLWEEGYPQYVNEHRATASYFCPDHFSGLMEILLCMGLGLAVSRRTGAGMRIWGSFSILLGITGVVLSKSRGGGLTLLVIFAGLFAFGFYQWSRRDRWMFRGGLVAVAVVLMAAFALGPGRAYADRFQDYFAWRETKGLPLGERVDTAVKEFKKAKRWRMMAGAYRAWKSAPVLGIGPGMHQNLWPHFSASEDGDRDSGVRPSDDGRGTHSYFVHNDWLQLMEEYGIVGLVLFLWPFAAGITVLALGLRRDAVERETGGRDYHATTLAGLLAVAAFTFHSLGDFNLQIPATVWLFSVVVSIPLAGILRTG